MIRANTHPTREGQGLVWVGWGAPPAPAEAPAGGAPTPLRSLHLDAPAARVLETLDVAPAADGLVRTSLGGLPVLVALQPLCAGQSAAHILIDGPADAFDSADRAQAARACTALRRTVEARAARSAAETRAAP